MLKRFITAVTFTVALLGFMSLASISAVAANTNETMETNNLPLPGVINVEEVEVNSSIFSSFLPFYIIFIGVILVGITISLIISKRGKKERIDSLSNKA